MKTEKSKLTIEKFILRLSKDQEFCEIISDFLDVCLRDPNFLDECLEDSETNKKKNQTVQKGLNS